MPSPQAVNELASTLTNIFNDGLPETDTSLPQETQNAINDAMASIRDKNEAMAQQMAAAINTFIKKSTVKVSIQWQELRGHIMQNIDAYTHLTHSKIEQAQTQVTETIYVEGLPQEIQTWPIIHLASGLTTDIYTDFPITIETPNAIE